MKKLLVSPKERENVMIRKAKTFLFALALAASSATIAISANAGTYAVVVNSGNGYQGSEAEIKETIKRLYLKQQSSWPGGEGAVPFGRAAGSSEQAAFAKNVLGLDSAALAAHWAKLKQTVGETPPREIDSTSILFRQISRKKGSLGVVSEGDLGSAPAEAKVLLKFSD